MGLRFGGCLTYDSVIPKNKLVLTLQGCND